MTCCIPDTCPEEWHRFTFSSSYLYQINKYLMDTKVNAKLSGAISYGILGPAPTVIAFENKEDADVFADWFKEHSSSWPVSYNGIMISYDECLDDGKGEKANSFDETLQVTPSLVVCKKQTWNVSHVTQLPKG